MLIDIPAVRVLVLGGGAMIGCALLVASLICHPVYTETRRLVGFFFPPAAPSVSLVNRMDQISALGHGLSIVIPAFKPDFLAGTLESLARQRDRDFEVLVCDDASPHALAEICAYWAPALSLRYVRFESNLGGRQLTAQWERSISLASNDWVLLLGDDDQLESGCVQALKSAMASLPGETALLHLDVVQIDASDAVTAVAETFPNCLSSRDYVAGRMAGRLRSYTCDFAFRRSVLSVRGGFVSFPLAYCSDDASWVRLAGEAGIMTVSGPQARARWRLSTVNITGRRDNALPKAEAMLAYLSWLHCLSQRKQSGLSPDDWQEIAPEALRWLSRHIQNQRLTLDLSCMWRFARCLSKAVGISKPKALLKLALIRFRVLRDTV